MAITVTSLELNDRRELRRAADPRVAYELERCDDPPLHRWFYERIGADWSWTDRLVWPDERGERVWVHTCSLDSPAALPNYEARGMRVFKRERRERP